MTYIDRLNFFHEVADGLLLPTSAQIVYLKLLHINNKLAWTEQFRVSDRRLRELCGYRNKNIINAAKNRLKQCGLIDFTANGKETTIYRILAAEKFAGTGTGTDTGTDTGTLNRQDKTRKEKKSKKENEYAHKKTYSRFGNVLLTDEELGKLKEFFPDYQDRIERLGEYIASKGVRYKSHYATILAWARKDGAKIRGEEPFCDVSGEEEKERLARSKALADRCIAEMQAEFRRGAL